MKSCLSGFSSIFHNLLRFVFHYFSFLLFLNFNLLYLHAKSCLLCQWCVMLVKREQKSRIFIERSVLPPAQSISHIGRVERNSLSDILWTSCQLTQIKATLKLLNFVLWSKLNGTFKSGLWGLRPPYNTWCIMNTTCPTSISKRNYQKLERGYFQT